MSIDGSATQESGRDGATETPLGRREFIAAALAGIGTLALGRSAGASIPEARAPQAIGLQLYTVRDLMDRDVGYTLREVAAVGYKEVEFAGLFGNSPAGVGKLLRKTGLTSPASHIPVERLRSSIQSVVDEAQALGNRYVVVPWIDAAQRRTADDWRRIAADFNRFGEALQRVGLRFAYHNHEFEFAKLPSGEIGYDVLLTDCDPKLVRMELDLFWITKGGRDPLDYFAKWPGRFPLVHVKDMAGSGTMTNVGQGHIDWGRIFAKRREAGIEHFFVEHDNPRSPLADIKASFGYMARLEL